MRKMIEGLQKIPLVNKVLRSEFNRNALTLVSGTAIAQAILVLISPILTRLYSPADFGDLALFISITSIIGVIANGRYELAIMLPEKDEDAINVAAAGFLFNILISLLFSILIIIFKIKY
jgi:O-antigen/teichoic acid export membrane protein